MPGTTVTSKGQVTLPKLIRDALGVHAGDRIVFRLTEDGRVVVEADTVDLRSLRGSLKPKQRGVTVEQMDAAIRKSGTRR